MIVHSNLRGLVEPVVQSVDPLAALRERVIETGGQWADARSTDLFEISYAGITSIGFGPKEAAQNWISRAKAELSIEPIEPLP